jgi:ABC-type hemin transport system substrate-binding protein
MPVIKRFPLPLLLAAIACLAANGLTGCDDRGPAPLKPKDGGETSALRIVSLSPALTQMVIDLGQRGALVGVDDSHGVVFDKLDVPMVGTYANIRAEMILGLHPTHVIAMVGAEGPPAQLGKLAETGGFKLVTFPYPTGVTGVLSILIGDRGPGGTGLTSEKSLAHLLGSDHGFLVALEMNKQLARVSDLTDTIARPGFKPKVLLVFGLDPRIQAAGPETVLDDLLTKYAGGYNAAIPDLKPLTPEQLNAIADPEKRRAAILAASADPALSVGTAPTFDREKLLEHKPDVILLFMPGEPALEALDKDPRLADLRGLDIPAVKNSRIILINDKTALLPGTGLPRIAAQMAKAIYPALAPRLESMLTPSNEEKNSREKADPDREDPPVKDPEKKEPENKEPKKADPEKKLDATPDPGTKETDPPKVDPAK